MHILLMYNMGNSGGTWFKDVCNLYPEVNLIIEANHYLNLNHLPLQKISSGITEWFIKQTNDPSTQIFGLIKSLNPAIIEYCQTNNISHTISQMLRHPVGVVNFKMGFKKSACKKEQFLKANFNDPKINFEAHVSFYSNLYQSYIDRNHSQKHHIIKLEDLNESIRTDMVYFKNIIQDCLKIPWREKYTNILKNMYHYNDDLRHFDIWNSWSEWQRNTFDKYFHNIMKTLRYSYVGNINNVKYEPDLYGRMIPIGKDWHSLC